KQNKEHFRAAIAPEGEKILIHTSNFRSVKRVEDVLRIFCGVRQTIPAKLLLVGDGPDRSRMEKLARELDCQRDGVTGMLSNIGDVEDMVKNSLYVLADDNLPRFKAAALARAEEFAVGNIVPLYEQCYERAMQLALQSVG
nr:hypothetical protein [Tanacetum cinerariifolium]